MNARTMHHNDHAGMRNATNPSDEALKKVLGSTAFAKSPKLAALLQFLFDNIHRPLSAKEIETEHFGVAPDSTRFDPDHVRALCLELRKKLERHAAANKSGWRFELPEAVRGEGYQLRYVKLAQSATDVFWQPHLEDMRNVVVVCNSNLFFVDLSTHMVMGCLDVETDRDPENALSELKRRHKASATQLQRTPPYFSSGELDAHETLQSWFHARTHMRIPRCISRDMADRDFVNASPILLGRPSANTFIRRILGSPEAAHFAYRFQKPLGSVRIESPTAQEASILSSRFPWTTKGVLGPTRNLNVVFGIVTRLRNPGGKGAITIISADDGSTVIAQIAAALTTEESTERLLRQIGLSPEATLPESFEMLFAVRRAPGNMDAEGHAELLTWRQAAEATYSFR